MAFKLSMKAALIPLRLNELLGGARMQRAALFRLIHDHRNNRQRHNYHPNRANNNAPPRHFYSSKLNIRLFDNLASLQTRDESNQRTDAANPDNRKYKTTR